MVFCVVLWCWFWVCFGLKWGWFGGVFGWWFVLRCFVLGGGCVFYGCVCLCVLLVLWVCLGFILGLSKVCLFFIQFLVVGCIGPGGGCTVLDYSGGPTGGRWYGCLVCWLMVVYAPAGTTIRVAAGCSWFVGVKHECV